MSDPMDHASQPAPLPADVRRETVVVIAAYNEAATIEAVARGAMAHAGQVVVVDDGSSDGTAEAARRATPLVLRHAINRGQGAALQTGIEFALRRGARYIVTFDADGQHRPEDIPAMVAPIARGDCDITLGSRFLGSAPQMPAIRRWVLRLGVVFTRLASGASLTDTHNGFRAFSAVAARRICITLDGMAHASELLDQVVGSGLAYLEVPVHVRYTEYSLGKGQSSRGAVGIVLRYLLGRLIR
jgi:glycosyltransferase involved in cell wall biosynthesis